MRRQRKRKIEDGERIETDEEEEFTIEGVDADIKF